MLLLAIELSVIQIVLRVHWTFRRLDIGRNPAHRAQNHQFRVALLRALALEEIAEDRDIAQSRYLVPKICDPVVHQAGDDEALAILQFEFSIRLTGADGGYGGSGNGDRVREIQCAHFRHDMQVDAAVRLDHGSEPQSNAEFAKLNCDGW